MTTKRDVDGADSLRGWLQTLLLTLAIVLVPRVVLCQPFTIPSGSMEPTLQVGDYILVSKYPYGWSRHSLPLSPPLPQGRLLGQAPARGDIVVFKKPNDGRTDVIKRLIGLPGDKVQVVEGVLRINDRPVRRELVGTSVEAPFGEMIPVGQFKETLPEGKAYVTNSWGSGTPGANTGVYTVPQGCFFVMGDNRDNSLDSRFDAGTIPQGQSACAWDAALDAHLPPELGMGYIPADDLVGRAELVVGSMKPGASLLKPWTLVSHLRWERTFKGLGGASARPQLSSRTSPAKPGEDPGPPETPRSGVGPGSARCALVRDDTGESEGLALTPRKPARSRSRPARRLSLP